MRIDEKKRNFVNGTNPNLIVNRKKTYADITPHTTLRRVPAPYHETPHNLHNKL